MKTVRVRVRWKVAAVAVALVGFLAAAGTAFAVIAHQPTDFNGDGKADATVFRPSNGYWYVAGVASFLWGTNGDVPVPADYNGDGKADVAVFRPSTGYWYIKGVGSVLFGTKGDIPVPADYNGDGKADAAVFRPSTGWWYLHGIGSSLFGTGGDIPAPADYNGDGKADVAVFRPSTGWWYVHGIGSCLWGTNGDIPVPGDYNGDGKADLAVFRPSTGDWFVKGVGSWRWGQAGDIPVAADYNGDGKADAVVFRPSTGYWYIRGVGSSRWGLTGDIPVAGNPTPTVPPAPPPPAGTNWLQFDGSSSHQGVNSSETTITAANVSSLKQHWQATLPSSADGAPVVATGVATPSGTQDLVIATTTGGGLVARNLETGAAVWSITFGPGTCKINNGANACYTTSSPVIDKAAGFVYTYGLDGKIHKVNLGTGAEMTTAPWPVVATLKPWDEKGSSALSSAAAANGHTYLYATNSGYPGDLGDYQGHLTAIDLSTGAVNVFNTLCSNLTVHFQWNTSSPTDCAQQQSGVWARSGATYSSATNRIYIVTGNADFNGTTDWGDTVLALNPDGTGSGSGPVDSYTPVDYQNLDTADLDLGSTLPAIVNAPAGSAVAGPLGVQGGKDGQLRLLNLANLSGQRGPGHTGGELQTVQGPGGGEVLTAPAVWVNGSDTWIEAATGANIAGYKLTLNASNQPQLGRIWQINAGGTSPVIANGVMYVAGNNTIRAYNPTTGAQLWSTATGPIHWQSPVVVDGLVLVEDGNGHLTAWGP
jgi:hypothetical protein